MLNIAKSVPPPESIPPIPELERTPNHSDYGINSTKSGEYRNPFYQLRPIPEFSELYPISASLSVLTLTLTVTQGDSPFG